MKPKPDCLMTMSDLREPPIGMDMSHNDPIKDILQDLIAELWSMAEHDDLLTEWIGPNLEQAEQRLRQVQGE